MSAPQVGAAQRWLRAVEAFAFGHRRLALLVMPALLLLLGIAALRAPVADPYAADLPASLPGAASAPVQGLGSGLGLAEQYRAAFGGANLLRVALVNRDGGIDDPAFLAHLARLTETFARLPGVGAGRVHSLFSADARFIDVVDARYFAAALAPPALREAVTPALIAKLHANLAKAQALGRWVSGDLRGALIEIESAPDVPVPELAALRQLIAQELATSVSGSVSGAAPGRIEAYVTSPAIEAEAARQRLLRSLPALLLALALVGAVLWAALGHAASLLAAVVAALATIGAFAAARLFGAGAEWTTLLASFALALALNVRFVAAWLAQAAAGRPGFDASLGVWRRLAGGAVPAALAAAAAFATLALLPFPAARAQAVALVAGAGFALLGERLLLPVLLSRVRIREPLRLSMRMARRARLAAPLAQTGAALARPEGALVLLTAAATIFGWSLWQRQDAVAEAGRAAGPDAQLIARAFPLAVHRLWIGAEADAWSCAQPQTLDQIDRLAWKLDNTRGVLATQSMPGVVRQIHTAFAEGSPKFAVLPRRRDMLIQAIAPLAPELRLGNADCSMLPVWVATDGRAETLSRVAATIAAFERDNAAEFFEARPRLDPRLELERCAARVVQRRESAATVAAATAPDADAKPSLCPVHVELGGGPLGLAAAQTRVLAGPARWLVWAALAAALLVLGGSFGSMAAALAALFGIAVAAPFVEAVLAARGVAPSVTTLPLAPIAVGLGAAFAAPLWQALAAARPSASSFAPPFARSGRSDAAAVSESVAALAITGLALFAAAPLLLSSIAGSDPAGRWFWLALGAALAAALVLLPVVARLAAQSGAPSSGRRY